MIHNVLDHLHPVLDHGAVQLLNVSPLDPALVVVNAARVSYDSSSDNVNDKDRKLISYLKGHGHTSPFRHCYLTFYVEAPIFVMRQWMKYQVGSTWRTYEIDGQEIKADAFDHMYDTDKGCSWNEQSGRYTEFVPKFYTPMIFRTQSKTNKQGSGEGLDPVSEELARSDYGWVLDLTYSVYKRLLDEGVSKEIARMVLPQCLYSTAYWTVSLQGLMHFLEERLKPEAQLEIREYANAILGIVSNKFPDLFSANTSHF